MIFESLLSWNITIFAYGSIYSVFGNAVSLMIIGLSILMDQYVYGSNNIDRQLRNNYHSIKNSAMLSIALLSGYRPIPQEIAALVLVGLTVGMRKLLIANRAFNEQTEPPLIICLVISLLMFYFRN